MNSEIVSKRILVIITCYSIVFFTIVGLIHAFDTATTIVFCKVAHGDATYLRVRNSVDILIDAGSDRLVTYCLGSHMPFYDKTIEYAFLTHVKKSQYEGYHSVLRRYRIKEFLVSDLHAKTGTFEKLINTLANDNTIIRTVKSGDVVNLPDGNIRVLAPLKSPNGKKSPSRKDALTVEFTYKINKLLFVGFMPNLASILQPNSYNYIKISEYGFTKNLFPIDTTLADSVSLLIRSPLSQEFVVRYE